MADLRHASTVAAVAVATLGAIPAGFIFLRTRGAGPAVSTGTTLVPIEAQPRTTMEVAPPDVPGLDPAISAVLYSSGNASAAGESDFSDLSPEIVRVLSYYDVVLSVPIADPTP